MLSRKESTVTSSMSQEAIVCPLSRIHSLMAVCHLGDRFHPDTDTVSVPSVLAGDNQMDIWLFWKLDKERLDHLSSAPI